MSYVCVAYVFAVICLLPGELTMMVDAAAAAMVCGCNGLQWNSWMEELL